MRYGARWGLRGAEAGAAELAAAEREELVQIRGVDLNGSDERAARIREMT